MPVILDKIKVVVRIRPPSDSRYDLSTKVENNYICVKDKLFSFDNVFNNYTRQEFIFETTVKPLIESFLMGINVSILAYGQTGSGKTHTMGTNISDHSLARIDCGIVPRTLEYIFSLDMVTRGEAECSIQFLELYNEEVRDLFPLKGRNSIIRLVDGKNGVTVSGLNSRNVYSTEEAMSCLREGSRARTTAATAMNSESSRSHAIFTVILTQSRVNSNGVKEIMSSKFNFVDLAGSERLHRTGAVGTRAKEGININFGLLALGNVINALAESSNEPSGKIKRHIPYRDSKLTRLLEDSLGGNSKCLMIACVCPSPQNIGETVNTLNYAARVKNIENKIILNPKISIGSKDDPDTCQRLQQRIDQLERELALSKSRTEDSNFVKEANSIFKAQIETNNITYKDAIKNVDPLCYVMTLEHDSRLRDCFPDELTVNNSSFEKAALQHKIKAVKHCSDGDYLDNTLPDTLIDHFVNKLDESTKINGLKLNSAVIKNAATHKQLPESACHELRWKYLLNFVCQRYILSDCVYKEVIKQYECQLSKSHKILKSSLSHLAHSPVIANDISDQIKQNQMIRTSIGQRKTPILSLQNLENKLNYLFPISQNQSNPVNESLINSRIVQTSSHVDIKKNTVHIPRQNIPSQRQEPMEVDEPSNFYTSTKTFQRAITTLKRRTSMKLSDQKINAMNEKQGFVKRNGLCLPIIKSPVRPSGQGLIKRSQTVIDAVPKRPLMTLVGGNTDRQNVGNRKVFSRKSSTQINVLENFRLRNLMKR